MRNKWAVCFDQVDTRVRWMFFEGLHDKLSVAEIKVFLKARGFPVGGKKADLLARLSVALKEA